MLETIQFIALVFCSVAAGGCAFYWSVVAFHIARTHLTIPTARRGLALARARADKPWPRVCVVIPAHNEESCIALVARSVLAQDYPDLTAVFALDRCTDRTREVLVPLVAGDPRAQIIDIDRCPADWAGKTHALWRGVEESAAAKAAELLLFIDADTVLDPACVRAAVALLEHRRLAMLSLLSSMTFDRWFERLVQPAAGMELLRQYPISRANSATHRRPFANGQFILVRREAYDAIGGHPAVHSALLEDVQIARELAWRHIPAGFVLADRMLHCRMYTSWQEFRRGWKRIFIEACNRKPARMRKQAFRMRWLSTWLPCICIAGITGALIWPDLGPIAPLTLTLCIGALAIFLFVVGACYAMGNAPLWFAPLYPLGAWHVGGIMREAARDLDRGIKTVWGGREYVLTPR